MPQPDKSVKRLLATFEQSESDREQWRSLWDDISDFVAPIRHIDSKIMERGRSRQKQTYDDTAQEAAKRLSASIHGLLTSPSLQWFKLKALDDRDDESQAWIEVAEEKMMNVFNSPSTGFNSSIHEVYQDLVSFGTGALMVNDRPGSNIRFTARPLFEMYPVQDDDFQIKIVFRKFEFTAYQAQQKFGFDSLSDKAKKDFDSKDKYTKTRCYIHAVMPREERDARMANSLNMPIASVMIDREAEKKVAEGGFREMPLMVPRWNRAPGETFGRSPASSVIDEIRLASVMKKTLLKAAEKMTDPPLLLPDGSMLSPVRTNPGGLNYVRPGMADQITPLPSGDPRIGVDLLQDVRQVIRDAFFLDVLDLPLLDRMTATEVIQRRQDKLQVMAPFVSRLQEELLSPMISRVLNILVRRGEIEAPPQQLTGPGMEVEYVSPLAVSQRSSRIQSFQIWLSTVTPLGQIDPSIFDSLDPDAVSRDLAHAANVPASYMRSLEEVDAIRQQRAQQQQIQQLGQAAEAGGQIAGALEDSAQAAQALGLAG